MARAFEQEITEHPEDWHMLQKVFVNDLDPERLARSRARAGNGNGKGNENGHAVMAVAEPAAALPQEPVAGAEPATATKPASPPDEANGAPA
jgi:KDO2-lipid IV(A) lauroyltransferase